MDFSACNGHGVKINGLDQKDDGNLYCSVEFYPKMLPSDPFPTTTTTTNYQTSNKQKTNKNYSQTTISTVGKDLL